MKGSTTSSSDIIALASFARLELTPRLLQELAESYQYVQSVLDRMPHGLAPAVEPAHTFDPRKFISEDDQP
jgi:hypothetical protein